MRFRDKYITQEFLEEQSMKGISPWVTLLEEAKKVVDSDDEAPIKRKQEVHSDDESEPEEEEEYDENEEEEEEDGGFDGDGDGDSESSLSEEELGSILEKIKNSPDPEGALKELFDNGEINEDDIKLIMQQLGDGENLSPEEEAELQKANQINSIQEMTVRFSIYDKIIKLNQKLEIFIEHFTDIDSEFFKEVVQLNEYIQIINNLIFNLEINLVYQLYSSLELKLISLFTEYRQLQQRNGD